uniref:Uncharacterized protein n=1 Tax=Globodera rostochiensis TaxID=31243 RepID=A0A914IC23_GLORO
MSGCRFLALQFPPKMLTMKLLCICGLLATLQNVAVAMNNPYQGGTAPPVDNESGSEEEDEQVPPQHAGGFGTGMHQQSNMMMHGGVPVHPSQQWPQQSSALTSFNSNNPAQQYGSQQHPGMNMPSPTGSFNSNPNSMGSFNSNPHSMGSFNSNPQFAANPQQPNMGMMQQQPNNHLPQLFQLMQQQPNNPMVTQLFQLVQQQPNNPMISQLFQLMQQQPNNPMISQMIQMALQPPAVPAMPTMMQQNSLNRNMSSNPSMLHSSPSMSMPGFQPNPGYGPNQGQTPPKTTGRRNSRTSNASGLSNTNVMQPPAFVSYYVHEERVTYPVSMNQNGADVMPFMLEACVDMDLQRKRLSLMDCVENPKSKTKKILADKDPAAIDYGKLVKKLLEVEDSEDTWTNHIHTLQKAWITDVDQNQSQKKAASFPFSGGPKNPYLKQLIINSAMNRDVLLFLSLHNATFGRPNTDFADLNEIMVTTTNKERENMRTLYSNINPDKNLCTALRMEESKLKPHKYGLIIESLCQTNRDEYFKLSNNDKLQDINQDAQIFLKLLQIEVQLTCGDDVLKKVHKALDTVKDVVLRAMMSLLRYICCCAKNAFNDATRILLLRGPVDLIDIRDEYGDEKKLCLKKEDIAKVKQKGIKYEDAVKDRFNSDEHLKKHLYSLHDTFANKKKDSEAYAISGYIDLLEWLEKKEEGNENVNWMIIQKDAIEAFTETDLLKCMTADEKPHEHVIVQATGQIYPLENSQMDAANMMMPPQMPPHLTNMASFAGYGMQQGLPGNQGFGGNMRFAQQPQFNPNVYGAGLPGNQSFGGNMQFAQQPQFDPNVYGAMAAQFSNMGIQPGQNQYQQQNNQQYQGGMTHQGSNMPPPKK